MLVLSRKPGEQLQIGDNVTITILAVHGQRIRLGIEAPMSTRVLRGELKQWNGQPREPRGDRRTIALVG